MIIETVMRTVIAAGPFREFESLRGGDLADSRCI
nr:MAG TPA_asm: hypothetical protein [Caudoviricetes sp.]